MGSLNGHQRPHKGATHVWLTPRYILNRLGSFDLDPCAAPSPRPWSTAIVHIELPYDGLAAGWHGRVWLNPPFDADKRPLWMAKMATHGNGTMLIPAATETKAFRDHVWGRADGVLFLSKRPNFCRPDGTPGKLNSGAAMCLVSYGSRDTQILAASGLGTLVKEWRTVAA